jgi:DNA adenine methylase
MPRAQQISLAAHMKGLHPIPYQGSKRRVAEQLLRYIPTRTRTLFEPFCGSAALSLAALHCGVAERVCLNDSLVPLVGLWQAIASEPLAVADAYEELWRASAAQPREHYDLVRAAFNESGSPVALLYLLTRCVKSAIRFNSQGQFNQSPDLRRRGATPEVMRARILGASALLRDRLHLACGDFAEAVSAAGDGDVVYLDPPFQGTSRSKDRRYHRGLERERLIAVVSGLRARGVPVIVSFDGTSGERTYGNELPAELGLVRVHLQAGRSTQGTLLGRNLATVESLYVDPVLVA